LTVTNALDRLALCALVAAVPVALVDGTLSAAGVAAERVRILPPWVTTYHVLASAMCPSAGYDDITDLLWTTLPAATGRGLSRQRPSRSAITKARSRLGTEPLALLLRRTVHAVSDVGTGTAVDLHRYDPPGAPGLWWITAPDTGALRGCDVRGGGLDIAVVLLRGASVARVTVDLPVEETAGLQARLGPGVLVVTGPSATAAGTPWDGLRARTGAAWKQDALARACVSVALERASTIARQQAN
jgi:hypothetical protein